MPIRILPPEVSAKIAAGEVIERPAAVAKELIENALDAGATRVTVEAAGGGVRLLRVSDDGRGIPPEELETAFERHATSKLACLEDLERVSTLGFRGEALPSIAAVADVTLVTRPPDHTAGAYIHFLHGRLAGRGSRGCPPGTTVTVRDLFQSLPARLKFLKSSATEERQIAHLVSNLALARPAVAFTLVMEGKTALRSPGTGELRDAAAAVYGHQVASGLLPVGSGATPGDGQQAQVRGLVSPPVVGHASRANLSFFVNGRWVQSRALGFALEEAYRGMLMTGRHPLAIIVLTVPTEDVDVNVHPTKAQVRFRDERAVAAAVHHEVKQTLASLAPVPTFSREAASVQAASELPLTTPPGPPRNGGQRPHADAQGSAAATQAPAGGLPALRVLGQVAETYIVAEGPDGMYLVDQHAAHERLLYNELQAQRGGQGLQFQGLLEPVAVELSPRQAGILEEQGPNLAQGGFLLEAFGPGSCLLRGVPAPLRAKDPAAALREVLDFLDREEALAGWEERLAAAIACHGAVRAGQRLSADEMRDLLGRLELASAARTCPHGRPTLVHIAASQLEREFGRRG